MSLMLMLPALIAMTVLIPIPILTITLTPRFLTTLPPITPSTTFPLPPRRTVLVRIAVTQTSLPYTHRTMIQRKTPAKTRTRTRRWRRRFRGICAATHNKRHGNANDTHFYTHHQTRLRHPFTILTQNSSFHHPLQELRVIDPLCHMNSHRHSRHVLYHHRAIPHPSNRNHPHPENDPTLLDLHANNTTTPFSSVWSLS